MFKVGQKVVCIKPDDFGLLVKDEIYTVSVVCLHRGIKVRECFSDNVKNGYFYSYRFREIEDNWVEELLCKLIEEVEADELVSV